MIDDGNDRVAWKVEKLAWKQEKRALKAERKQAKRARKRARKDKIKWVHEESDADRARVAELLSEIARGVEHGALSSGQGEETLTVTPCEPIGLRVRVRQDAETQGISIRLRWPREPEAHS